ncbi:MAG: dipeptide epimerase [Clostridia bacterium]
MRIKDIQIGYISLPLRHPFKTALRTVNSVEDLVVKIIGDDGQVGYGEAPPTAVITGETLGSIECAIMNFIKPAIVGMEITELDTIMKKMHKCIVKNTSAKACVDMAIYDLYGKALKAPVYKLLGGSKNTINTDITISVNPVEQMVLDSIEAKNRGYDILKVKVGKDGLKDVESIKAIRDAVGPDVVIRVDANQGWTAKQSVAIISAMEDAGLDIELVEQPVTAHDLEGMKYITKNVQTKILADESVFSAEDAIHIIQTQAADLINIKLMKTGGIHKALEICAVANIYNVECMIGCMLESRLSVSAGVHLGAGQSIITLADLDGPSLCSVDPFTGGPIFNENIITMSDDFGIGVDNIPCSKWF